MSHYSCPYCSTPILLTEQQCPQCGRIESAEDATLVASLRPESVSGAAALTLETADGTRFAIQDRDVLGRSEIGREVLLPYVQISRRHAQFLYQDQRWFVVDLNSSNGTFLDGQKLVSRQPTPLTDGQRIELSPLFALTARIVAPQPAPRTLAPEPPDPNRRTLVILFADIKGSVDFFQERGTFIARNWIFKLFDMLTKIIEEHGGTHLKNIGDALLAVFDDPVAAARAAVKMQRVVKAHNQIVAASDHYYLRIGMNKGSVLFENNDVFGNAVNIASRVQDLAPPEKIYITGVLRETIQHVEHLRLQLVGHKTVKGVKSTIEVHEILVDG